MTLITLIVAIARNRAIGHDNQLLWHLPGDLPRFKKLTMGAPIIMGRKTWDSIGKPLPGRRNIVVSRNPWLQLDGAETVRSLEAGLALCVGAPEIFVIGGAQIYTQAMPCADKLLVTEVDKDAEGDAFFPEIAPNLWQEVAREAQHAPAPLNLNYAYVTYVRRGYSF